MYSFIVSDEVCPGCGHDTYKQDAIHIQENDDSLWTTASANAPFGVVTEDEIDEADPDPSDRTDLILDTYDVTITCVKCGHILEFTAENEE